MGRKCWLSRVGYMQMSKPTPKPPMTYAPVCWTPEDIQDLRPEWTLEECTVFLETYGRYIQEALVSAGYNIIETFIIDQEADQVHLDITG